MKKESILSRNVIVCSDAMYAGIEEFQKYLPEAANTSIGKIAIGVVEGDTHDIGKNLVKIMMETEDLRSMIWAAMCLLTRLWIM